jgi:hypothetical protein
MSNGFYNVTGTPSSNSQGASSPIRAEFALIAAAFDKLPVLTAKSLQVVRVNSGETALEAVPVTGTGSVVMSQSPTLVTPNLGAAIALSLALSGQMTSTLATGTPPFVVASTTQVANLYASRAALADSVTNNANLSGPITSSGNVTAVGSQTGTGSKFVMDTSPVLVTPNIGVATATSINGVGYTGTGGKTLTVNNTLTLAGTDGSTLNIGGGGTLGSAAFTAAGAYATVAQATSALAATGGSINNVTIGLTTQAEAAFTRVSILAQVYNPGLNASYAIDWAKGAGLCNTNGNNTVTFSNLPPSGFMGQLFLAVTNFNNVTWPASVLWGTGGKPSVAGTVRVSLVTLDGGVSITATLFWQ